MTYCDKSVLVPECGNKNCDKCYPDFYTSFIKNGLNVGFTDDQIDFLWDFIIRS